MPYEEASEQYVKKASNSDTGPVSKVPGTLSNKDFRQIRSLSRIRELGGERVGVSASSWRGVACNAEGAASDSHPKISKRTTTK